MTLQLPSQQLPEPQFAMPSQALCAHVQDELIELFASMDKAKSGVESGTVSKVCTATCAHVLPVPEPHSNRKHLSKVSSK